MGRFLAASVVDEGQTGKLRPILRAAQKFGVAPKRKPPFKGGFSTEADCLRGIERLILKANRMGGENI
jgi:hypothetical protein